MLKFLTLIFFLSSSSSSNSLNPILDSDNSFDFKVSSIHALIKSNKWSCVDVIEYFIERSAIYDPNIRSIISYNGNAIKRAVQLDTLYKSNSSSIGKLHCVPFIVKDNIDIVGMATTGGVKPFRNQVPEKNAMVIERLLKEGAVVVAKTNMAQLAIGALYESDQAGLCLNPYDSRRTCSGSSSGSAAGIAAGFGVVGLGSDTGGSIIGPSTFNGVFGLRPPVDSGLTDGVLPVNLRKDTIGPIAKHLDDMVLTYSVLTENERLLDVINKPIDPTGLKVLIIKNFMDSFKFESVSSGLKIDYSVNPELKILIDASVQRVKSLGVRIEEKTLNSTELEELTRLLKSIDQTTLPCTIACLPKSYQDYWNNSQRYGPDLPFKSFKNFVESPLLNPYWLSEFKKANINLDMDLNVLCEFVCKQYDTLNNEFKLFYDKLISEQVDAVFLPTITSKVKFHNETHVESKDDNFVSIALGSGSGFLTMPSGFTQQNEDEKDGLPFGMSLIIRNNKMENGFKIAKLYEMKQGFSKLPSSVPLLSKRDQQEKPGLIKTILNFFRNLFKF